MRYLLLGCSALAILVGTAATAEWRLLDHDQQPAPAALPSQPVAKVSGDRIYLAAQEQTHSPLAQGDGEVNSILNVPNKMTYGDFVWDDNGVPQGKVWIRVDLGSQIISVFRAGNEIGTAVILYGADKKETPRGVFPILARDKDHRSTIYDAAMPYTLRLTPDGVSIHGSDVRWGLATHGCIGVPIAFAKLLFQQAKKGDDVIIVDGTKQDS